MTSKLNLLTALLLLAIITIKECQASSSTTISSRYTNNNFANPTSNNNNELDKYGIVNEVTIVKSPSSSPSNSYGSDKEEEYVTSFYKRVRSKHRCNLFGKVLECSSNHGSVGVSENGLGRSVSGVDDHQQSSQGCDGIDHSLDHYFDHELRTSSSTTTQDASLVTHGYGQQKYTHSAHVELTPYSSSSSSRAQAVRGGGGATKRMLHKPRTFVSKVHASDYGLDELDMDSDTTSSSRARSRSETIWAPPRASGYKNRRSHSQNGHSHRSMDHSVDFDFDTDEYDSSLNLEDDIQDILDGVELEEEEVHSSGSVGLDEHHHLGLLRVPCSIAVNSGEATQYASSHGTF